MTTHLDRSLEPAAHRIHLHRTETVPVTRIELFALRDGARVVRRLQELYPRSQELEAWHHLFYATQDAMKQVLALPDFKSTDDWTATLIARALRVQSFSAIDFPRLDGAQSSALGSLNPDVPLAKALALLLLWPRWSLRSLTPEDLLGNAPTSPPYATNLRITWTDVLHVGKIIGFHFVARHRHLPRMVGIDESDALQHNRALDVILNAAATWEITDPLPFRTFAAIRLLDLLDPEERAGLDRSSLSVHLPAFDTACPDQMDLLASDETSIS